MKAKEALMKTALSRISVVQAYLSFPFSAEKFVTMYNSSGVNRHLLKDTGPITEETLLRWAEKCLAVTADIENTPDVSPGKGCADDSDPDIDELYRKTNTVMSSDEVIEQWYREATNEH